MYYQNPIMFQLDPTTIRTLSSKHKSLLQRIHIFTIVKMTPLLDLQPSTYSNSAVS